MTNDETNDRTPEAPATQSDNPAIISQAQVPGLDAKQIVGAPGKASSGKIYRKTGEFLSNEEYARRTEEDEAVMGYDEQIAALKAAAAAVNRETPEQKKKRERLEQSKKVIAATVDGLSALSNLFFTTQYAPNAYNPQSSQLGKVNERIEALKAERQADADRYNNYMLRLGDAQNAKAKTIRDMRAQHEAQKLAREKAERDAEAHHWQALLQPDKQREQRGNADRAEQQAITAEAEALYAPQMQEAKLQTEKARAGAQRASASASYASAAAHNRSNPNEFSAWDENGNEYKFRTKEAADRFAKQHGTWQEEDITSSTTTDRDDEINGHSSQTATTTKKGGRPVKPTLNKGKGYGDETGKGKGKGKGYGN